MGWLSALWPAIQAVMDAIATMFRRLVLGMFGGVAKEDAAADKARQQAPDAPEARPDAELEEWQVVADDRREAEAAPEPRGESGSDGSPPPDADPEAPTGPGRRP
ncbi:hypothetical protein A6A05_08945 [Magnetospirillum moscoviense]|uniref:Uncharacterized protein n=2 Tax=Magnetospirillum moscoviense TaxID=1437059 RepID=A0A178MVC5_9PROT|nr:hypothetical protein A6A05_08945 [Magnetospirillum moscoviense]